VRHLLAALLAVALAALAGCGGDDDAAAPADSAARATETPAPTAGPAEKVAFKLKEEHGSGKTGNATLRGGDDGLTVNVAIKGYSGPAHIHNVTCDEYRALKDFDAQLATVDLPLPDLEAGRSRSQHDAELSAYRTGGFSVNVHSFEGGFPVVACGDIPAG
jgi:hypothetical protein